MLNKKGQEESTYLRTILRLYYFNIFLSSFKCGSPSGSTSCLVWEVNIYSTNRIADKVFPNSIFQNIVEINTETERS